MFKDKRNDNLDIAKGIAILLMVWGHCIQYGNGSDYLQQQCYYSDMIFRSIYSFHMPLFAIIGGYLLSYSFKKRSAMCVLSSRLKSLGIPIIIWSLVNYIIEVSTSGMAESLIGGLKQYFWTLMCTLWFLWAILFCCIGVVFIHCFCKDYMAAFVVIFALALITPDRYNLNYFKFLYPFFAVGYLWQKKGIGEKMNKTLSGRIKFCVGGMLVTWLLLLTQFKKEIFIYQSGFTLLGKENPGNQLLIDVFRVLIGLCGSAWVLLSTSCIYKTVFAKLFMKFGKYSLGVYIVNCYVNLYILKFLCMDLEPNVVRTIALTCIIALVCLVAVIMIGKDRTLNKLLFGGR